MTIQRFSTGVFLLSVLGAAMSVSLPAQQAPDGGDDDTAILAVTWRR
jgi:hypothetical protein